MSIEKKELLDRLRQEYHRGTLTLVVLSVLKEKRYGYALVQQLQESGLDVSQDTIYPLLRRLEQQKLLQSEWIIDGSRPRKYYFASDEGNRVISELQQEWLTYTETIRGIIQ